jgi:hypothetical protein
LRERKRCLVIHGILTTIAVVINATTTNNTIMMINVVLMVLGDDAADDMTSEKMAIVDAHTLKNNANTL